MVAGGKQHAQTSTTVVAIDTSHAELQLCLHHINKQFFEFTVCYVISAHGKATQVQAETRRGVNR